MEEYLPSWSNKSQRWSPWWRYPLLSFYLSDFVHIKANIHFFFLDYSKSPHLDLHYSQCNSVCASDCSLIKLLHWPEGDRWVQKIHEEDLWWYPGQPEGRLLPSECWIVWCVVFGCFFFCFFLCAHLLKMCFALLIFIFKAAIGRTKVLKQG